MTDQPDSVAVLQKWGCDRLRDAGIDTPALDARLLLAEALRCSPSEFITDPGQLTTECGRERFRQFIEARRSGRPVSRLLGRRGFWDFELAIDDAVLDPRPDSETLITAILHRLRDRDAPLHVLDLGTGSGCLLFALLRELPNASGIATDISETAIRCARRNAEHLEMASRIHFMVGDWGQALQSEFDVIVVNPPYISDADIAGLQPEVAQHDPLVALHGGSDGFDSYRQLADQLNLMLGASGFAAVECGAGQAESIAELMRANALNVIETRQDLSEIVRCIIVAAKR